MKKNILSVILVGAIIASVSSCGGSGAASAPSTAAAEKDTAETYIAETYPVTTIAPSYAEDYDAEGYGYDESFDSYKSYDDNDGGYMGFNEEQRRAGMLTGGEWRDNSNFVFWKKLFEQRSDWAEVEQEWRLSTQKRVFVRVKDANGVPAAGMTVKLTEKSSKTIIWETVTDSRGEAFLFGSIDPGKRNPADEIIVEAADGRAVVTDLTDEMKDTDAAIEIAVPESPSMRTELDLMLMIDTTGSMGDELKYLQTELGDVINRVENATNADVQLSVNFYRDRGDDYVVRDFGFTTNIGIAIDHLNDQRSDGGGDYPEAVTAALDNGINGHQWRSTSEKIMLLVLDAPPHLDDALQSLKQLIQQAAKLGIRIIPVASSGVDTQTEFLCRCMAMATGGTYTFLTDDSGIGNSHLEPTVGNYTVEKLNDMLVRLISDYFSQEPRSYAEPIEDDDEPAETEEIEAVNGPAIILSEDGKTVYPGFYNIMSDYFDGEGMYISGVIRSEKDLSDFDEKYGFMPIDRDYDFSRYIFAYSFDMLSSGSITVDESKGVYCTLDGDKPLFYRTYIYPEVCTADIKTIMFFASIPVDASSSVPVTAASSLTKVSYNDDWLDRMEEVDSAIDELMSSVGKMTSEERADEAVKMLISLADSGLVVRETILYDGGDVVSFEYDIGGGETVLGGINLNDTTV